MHKSRIYRQMQIWDTNFSSRYNLEIGKYKEWEKRWSYTKYTVSTSKIFGNILHVCQKLRQGKKSEKKRIIEKH